MASDTNGTSTAVFTVLYLVYTKCRSWLDLLDLLFLDTPMYDM